jgi:hypothetical protein
MVYSILETADFKNVGCFKYTVYQYQAHLYNCSTKKYIHFNYMTLLRHVSCVQRWLIWFYVLLLSFDSLKMVPGGLKHVGMCSVIL